jgi:transcriptional regulator with XRE-family HTH domain
MVFSREKMGRALRERGLTWAQTARKSGMSQNGFWQVMRGFREPKISTVSALCAALGVSFLDAFEDEGGGSDGAA